MTINRRKLCQKKKKKSNKKGTAIYLSRFDKGSDKYWTSVADNFLRYKKNGWNTDKKFSEEKILEKQKKYKQKYKIY